MTSPPVDAGPSIGLSVGMPPSRPDDQRDPEANKALVVAVGFGTGAIQVVSAGKRLADALQKRWEAIHVETPGDRRPGDGAMVAEALSLAAAAGATVAKIPAATVADGLIHHLQGTAADQLVMGNGNSRLRLPGRPGLLGRLTVARPDLLIHLVPVEAKGPPAAQRVREGISVTGYGYAVAAVALTVLLAMLLNRTAGIRFLSILFLFPVVAMAARRHSRHAIAAALMSTLAFNYFFLAPAYQVKLMAMQSWVMGAVLVAIALYVGAMTANLRGRTALSERSAQENARIAAFAMELTRVAEWTETAKVICTEVSGLLGVQSFLAREISAELRIVASVPHDVAIEPLDKAALDWTWLHGKASGSGSSHVSNANWRFEPLKTSLGMLAVLGLAREDGRNPVAADRAVLLSTLTSQAALALERLRLEDLAEAGRDAARS